MVLQIRTANIYTAGLPRSRSVFAGLALVPLLSFFISCLCHLSENPPFIIINTLDLHTPPKCWLLSLSKPGTRLIAMTQVCDVNSSIWTDLWIQFSQDMGGQSQTSVNGTPPEVSPDIHHLFECCWLDSSFSRESSYLWSQMPEGYFLC